MMVNSGAGETPEAYLMSVKDVGLWLGIPKFTIYSWALAHRIPHFKLGKRVMFSKDDLKRWLEDHRAEMEG